jgi:hypothetical protein
MILELAAGVEGDTQEPRKLFFAFLPSSLNDIRRDGYRRSNYLTAECLVLRPTHSSSDAMGMHGQCVRLPPNMQFLEIAHAEGWRRQPQHGHRFIPTVISYLSLRRESIVPNLE